MKRKHKTKEDNKIHRYVSVTVVKESRVERERKKIDRKAKF